MRPAAASPGAASHEPAGRGAGGTASSASASASGCARAASELPLAPICCSQLVAGVVHVQEGMGSYSARRLQQHRDTQGDAQQSHASITQAQLPSRVTVTTASPRRVVNYSATRAVGAPCAANASINLHKSAVPRFYPPGSILISTLVGPRPDRHGLHATDELPPPPPRR